MSYNLENYSKDFLFEQYLCLKLRNTLTQVKVRADKQGVKFDLKIEDLMPVPTTCEVLGVSLDWFKDGYGPSDNSPSIDRVVPSEGYTKANCKIISQRANRLKQNSTAEELKAILNYVQKEQARKEEQEREQSAIDEYFAGSTKVY